VFDKVKMVEEEKVDNDNNNGVGALVEWLMAVVWVVWPLRGLYGVYRAVVGGDYLLQKRRRRVGEGGQGLKES
jgi:hypothetical protein